MTPHQLALLVTCLMAAGATVPSVAASITWAGDTSSAWASGANWVGGTAPSDDTSTDIAAFAFSAAPAFQPNTGTRSISGVTIGDGITSVPSFTISGTRLTIGGSGVSKLAGSGSTTLAVPTVLDTAQSWINDSDDPLTISGSVNADGHLFTLGGSGTMTVTGIISGSAGLRKEGSGELFLEAANTFTGGVTIAGGVIEAGKNGTKQTLGPDSNVLTFDGFGATLRLADTVLDSNRDYDFLQAGTIDTNGYNLTLRGAVTGSAGLTKAGLGRLRLQGINTFSGTATVSSGTLELAGNTAIGDTAAVVLANDATSFVNVASTETIGSLAGGGASGGTVSIGSGVTLTTGAANESTTFAGWLDGPGVFLKTGSGRLVLSNTATNDAYTGRVDIDGGTISIAAVEALGKRGTTREFHFYDGATLETTADMSFNTRVFQLYTADGDGIAGRFDVAADTTTVLKGDVQGLSGSGGLLKKGSGILSLDVGATQSKTYQGPTVVSEGTLRINSRLTRSPSLTVAAGSMLSGTGRIDKAVTTIAGTHAPGQSSGIQQFGVDNSDVGDLTYLGGSSVIWELMTSSTASRGANYDGINVVGTTGTLDFAGSTSLHLSFSGTTAGVAPVSWSDAFWDSTQVWLVYDVAGTTSNAGNLSVYLEDWLDGTGGRFNTLRPTGGFSLQQTGADMTLVYAPVPEPSAMAIVATGLAGIAAWRRSRGGQADRPVPSADFR